MFSLAAITPEYNNNFCHHRWVEKLSSRASGGGNATAVEPSLDCKSLILIKRDIANVSAYTQTHVFFGTFSVPDRRLCEGAYHEDVCTRAGIQGQLLSGRIAKL